MAEKSKYQDIDAVDAALDKGVAASTAIGDSSSGLTKKVTDLELKVGELIDERTATVDVEIEKVSNYYISKSTKKREYYSPYRTYGNIPVKKGQKVSVDIELSNADCAAIAFSTLGDVYTQTFEILAEYKNGVTHYESSIENDGYIFISANETNPPTTLSIEQEKKVWTGKKWVVIGDSLTEKNARATKFYYEYISERTGINVVNFGVGGTGYYRQYDSGNSFAHRALNIPEDADVVTIFGSFNDKGIVATLGNIDEGNYDTSTIVGCINTCIKNVYDTNPLVKLGIAAPCPWKDIKPLSGDAENSYFQYVNAIKEICRRRGIPFIDLFTESGLRPWDDTFRELVYDKDQGGDGNPAGCHPNEIGHEMLASHFQSLLERLLLH